MKGILRRIDIAEAAGGSADPSLLPEQLVDSRSLSRSEGCYRLLVSVLETAIEDCVRRSCRREGSEAAEWIFSSEARSPLPFLVVCDALDPDSETLRRRVRVWCTTGLVPRRLAVDE